MDRHSIFQREQQFGCKLIDNRRAFNHRVLAGGALGKYKIRAYIIHCYRKTPAASVKLLIRKLQRCGIYATVVKCIHYKNEWLKRDGTPSTTFKKLYQNKYLNANAEMTGVEHAIAMSHKLALEKFHSQNTHKYGMILEDDVILRKKFAQKLDDMLTAIKTHKTKRVREFGIFYLWNSNAASTRSKLKRVIQTPEIYEETTDHNAGGVAYMVTKKFAKKEMDRALPIQDPSDVHNGYVAYRRHHKSMAFLTIRMELNNETRTCKRKLPQISRGKWYDHPCITSPLVQTNWYEDTTSHSEVADDFKLKQWEHFKLLKQKDLVPAKYRRLRPKK